MSLHSKLTKLQQEFKQTLEGAHMKLTISKYEKYRKDTIIDFLEKAFRQNKRQLKLTTKDNDLQDIQMNYMQKGCFWCLEDNNNNIHGTIALRMLDECWEIRRFFVDSKYQGKGYGKKLLETALLYAVEHNALQVKAATMKGGRTVHAIFTNAGFVPTTKYSNSGGDIFFKLEFTPEQRNKLLLIGLKRQFMETLILNPTENIPWKCNHDIIFTEGLYIPEGARGKTSKVVFAGRENIHNVMTSLYSKWEKVLSAAASSFKIYSGLHAHIILFMSIASIGDKALLLPENAGGHYASEKMLNRLGLQIKTLPVDEKRFCVDISKTKLLIDKWHPKFIFIDRSDGLYYEDFSWLKSYTDCYKIFDASQYLSHILAGDYINPFDMGMNLILTTLHKNYPGPQKAAFFTKEKDEFWLQVIRGVESYVSNIHPLEIFKAVLTLPTQKTLQAYSRIMLKNTEILESTLSTNGVPVVKRDKKQTQTQQIWIPLADQDTAYHFFKRLEKAYILTNYRLLPYRLGYGLRIGTAAATRQGLMPDKSSTIGELISEIYHTKQLTDTLIKKSAKEIRIIKNMAGYKPFHCNTMG